MATRTEPRPPSEAACELLLEQLREGGLSPLPWSDRSQQLRARMQLLYSKRGQQEDWPCRDLNHLGLAPETWLANALSGCLAWRDVSEDMLIEALWGDLPGQHVNALTAFCPSGSRSQPAVTPAFTTATTTFCWP